MKPTHAEIKLAQELQEEENRLEDEYEALLGALHHSLLSAAAADDRMMFTLAVAAFLSGLNELSGSRVLVVGANMIESINNVFGSKMGVPAYDPREAQLLMDTARQMVEKASRLAAVQAAQTGQPELRVAAEQIMRPRDSQAVKMGLDSVVTRTTQRMIFLGGLGIFERKIAVAVIDNRTTDLCRNRMNGQIRNWNDFYEDPTTGARWMYPPFIGGGLPPAEAFHWCRTSSLPYAGRGR